MDNLTHSLVGAIIGQAGLKQKTGLAMPTLVIAANLPDIDAVATLLGGHQHLAIRRGITHGPIAMLVLPLLLWAAMLWFDRWQAQRGTRPEKRLPVNAKWLLALAYIGCLSHPLFDWFNSYGVRLFEPFSSQWFYGDTLFIIDIWLWLLLGIGLWLSLRQERSGAAGWTRTARSFGLAAFAYIFINFAISTAAEKVADNLLRADGLGRDRMVVASPVPLAFWQREMLWRTSARYGSGTYSLLGGMKLEGRSFAHNAAYLGQRDLKSLGADAKAFLFWSRMPVLGHENGGAALTDQRFANPYVRGRFTVDMAVTE